MKSQSNNNFHYVVCAFLILLILCGLVVLNSYLIAQKASSAPGYDYSIVHGRDFANGKPVTTKMLNDDKTVVWTKYDGNIDGFSSFFTLSYTKYKFHHDTPLIDYLWRTAYIKNPFICIFVPSYTNWWHFEFKEWKCYFFKDVQGYPKTPFDNVSYTAVQFINYLGNNNLPIDEVQETYKEIVHLFNDKEKRNAFIDDFINNHEKTSAIALVANAAKTDSLPPGDIEGSSKARIILKYRDDFPDELPDVVMEKLLDVHPLPDASPEDTSFMLNNYLLRPTEYNALYVFLEVMGILQEINNAENEGKQEEDIAKPKEENRSALFDDVFDILHKHGMLEKCLSQIYSDDVETPPLPAPATIPSDYSGYKYINIYYTDTYSDLPEREKLLKISCFPEIFKAYWQERLKKLQEKQKEK